MQIIGVIQDMDYSNKKLEEENEYLRAHGVNIDKFYAKTMTVEMVAYPSGSSLYKMLLR